jgi:hypothetical protein
MPAAILPLGAVAVNRQAEFAPIGRRGRPTAAVTLETDAGGHRRSDALAGRRVAAVPRPLPVRRTAPRSPVRCAALRLSAVDLPPLAAEFRDDAERRALWDELETACDRRSRSAGQASPRCSSPQNHHPLRHGPGQPRPARRPRRRGLPGRHGYRLIDQRHRSSGRLPAVTRRRPPTPGGYRRLDRGPPCSGGSVRLVTWRITRLHDCPDGVAASWPG